MSESLNPLPFPVQIDPDALGRVVVLMGGHSSERNVSLDSGRNVLKALQAKGVNAEAFDPAGRSLGDLEKAGYDRAFIALHGRYGEDGTIQGMFEMAGVRYVGSGVLASAVGMDKHLMKIAFEAAGLPVGPYVAASGRRLRCERDLVLGEVAKLDLPIFVKPARGGSSIGITRVSDLAQLDAAITEAQRHDPKVIFEQGFEIGRASCRERV